MSRSGRQSGKSMATGLGTNTGRTIAAAAADSPIPTTGWTVPAVGWLRAGREGSEAVEAALSDREREGGRVAAKAWRRSCLAWERRELDDLQTMSRLPLRAVAEGRRRAVEEEPS